MHNEIEKGGAAVYLICKSEATRSPSDEREEKRLLLKISQVWQGRLTAVNCLKWLELESPWSSVLSPETEESAAMLAILLRVEARDNAMHVNRAATEIAQFIKSRCRTRATG